MLYFKGSAGYQIKHGYTMICQNAHGGVWNRALCSGVIAASNIFEGDFFFYRGGTVRSVLMYVSAVTTKSKGKSVEENGSGYWSIQKIQKSPEIATFDALIYQ